MENLEEVNQKIDMQNVEETPNCEPTLNEYGKPAKDSCGKHGNRCQILCYGIPMIVLFVAVVVLFVLHFTQKPQTVQLPDGQTQSGVILTVNNDSIVEHFELVNILKSDLEKESDRYSKEMAGKFNAFQEKVNNYQINVQNQILTQTQMQNTEAALMKEKTSLEALQERYATILANKERSVQKEIQDSIINATKRVNDAKYKADFVFATAEGSMIVTANPTLDITNEVIAELNNAYQKSKQ
ncbi:MAG: OmpH family outer membrane protein [Bacteroidales bacterium]|nr:OmpH family outer membrane protein [Bacteroidales bacterium]